jgi:hypothetical protein
LCVCKAETRTLKSQLNIATCDCRGNRVELRPPWSLRGPLRTLRTPSDYEHTLDSANTLSPCDILPSLLSGSRNRASKTVRCSSVEALAAQCDSNAEAAKSMPAFDLLRPPVEGAGPFSSTSLELQPAAAGSSRAAPQGHERRSGTWDLRPPAAAGGQSGSICRLREACLSTP